MFSKLRREVGSDSEGRGQAVAGTQVLLSDPDLLQQ